MRVLSALCLLAMAAGDPASAAPAPVAPAAIASASGTPASETLYMSIRSSRKARLPDGAPVVGMFVSRDAGKTWEHKGWRDQIKVFHTEAGPDGVIWSACGNGVLRSADGGETWKIATGWEITEALKVRADPGDPKVVYAATAYGVYQTVDGGNTWRERNAGLASTFTSDILVDRGKRARLLVATEDGIHVSGDRGRRWMPAGLAGKGIRVLAQDPSRAGVFWAGSEDDGVFRSDDGGASWKAWNHGASLRTVYAIAVDPKATGTVYLGTHEDGVWRSDDDGKSWARKGTGLKAPVVHAIAVLPSDPRIVLAGTVNGGLYRSEDRGETWTFVGQEEGQVWGLSVR